MDNVRIMLFAALAFILLLIWQAWERDYGTAATTANSMIRTLSMVVLHRFARHRVKTRSGKRVATAQPAQGQTAPFEGPVPGHGFYRVLGTGGEVTAARRQKRTEKVTVRADEKDDQRTHEAIREKCRLRLFSIVRFDHSPIGLRQVMTTSRPASFCRLARKPSRARRLIRLRETAVGSCLRVTDKPSLAFSC